MASVNMTVQEIKQQLAPIAARMATLDTQYRALGVSSDEESQIYARQQRPILKDEYLALDLRARALRRELERAGDRERQRQLAALADEERRAIAAHNQALEAATKTNDVLIAIHARKEQLRGAGCPILYWHELRRDPDARLAAWRANAKSEGGL